MAEEHSECSVPERNHNSLNEVLIPVIRDLKIEASLTSNNRSLIKHIWHMQDLDYYKITDDCVIGKNKMLMIHCFIKKSVYKLPT